MFPRSVLLHLAIMAKSQGRASVAAAWDDVGRASNMLQLLGVDAFGLVSMITQAALTARRNRDACLQLAEHGRVVAGLLRRLQGVPQLRRRPETRRPLEQLDDALRRAYLLVRSCGEDRAARSYLYQLLTGAHTAAKLRAAEEEIDRYIRLIPMIGLVSTAHVEGPEDLELNSEDSAPPSRLARLVRNMRIFSPRLSLEEVPESTAIPGLTPTGDVLLPEPVVFLLMWVRYLDDDISQYIEGATFFDYEVTIDDVGTVLGVEATPLDDNGHQGELVKANAKSKTACGIDFSGNGWEPATVMLRRTGYQIKLKCKDKLIIEEEYSQILQTKIPCGRPTQFVLICSSGVNLPFNTSGISEPNNEDNDARLCEIIVLVIRAFQKKALTLDGEAAGGS
ncbi:hypothetical protein ACP70R_043577 [Stipagrostis hirtigluma subsp. patula]